MISENMDVEVRTSVRIITGIFILDECISAEGYPTLHKFDFPWSNEVGFSVMWDI